jgi:hypothetical protein
VFSSLRRGRAIAATLVALIVATACTEAPVAVETAEFNPRGLDARWMDTITSYVDGQLQSDSTLWYRRVWICKVGTAAHFEISVNGGAPTTVALEADECRQVHYYAPWWDGKDITDPAWSGLDEITVTEVLTSDIVLDSIQRDSTHGFNIFRLPTLTGTNVATAYTTRSKGAILTFFNRTYVPPPPTLAGCTPGFWKQSQHFQYWTGYSPSTLFSDVFEDAFPGKTLLQVVSNGGGGLNALGRHTVAALLNAANPDVNYGVATPAEVIAAFNAAYPGTNSSYTTLKDRFEGFNEMGCTAKD